MMKPQVYQFAIIVFAIVFGAIATINIVVSNDEVTHCAEYYSGICVCNRNCTNHWSDELRYGPMNMSYNGIQIPIGKCDTTGMFSDISRSEYDAYIERIESQCEGKLTVYVGVERECGDV